MFSLISNFSRHFKPQPKLFVFAALLIGTCYPMNAFCQVPTTLTFHPTTGYAGNDCYELTVGNGASMVVDFDYTINDVPSRSLQQRWMAPVNGVRAWPRTRLR